jgi:sugar phosphate isomerase/epimerase
MRPRIGFVTQMAHDLEEELAFAAEAGFDYVEIMMDGADRRGSLADRHDRIEGLLADGGLDLLVHLPFPTDIGSPYDPIREGAVAHQEACIETAAGLGAEKGVLHPESSAWGGAWDRTDTREYVDASVDHLAAFGDERGLEVCVENLFDNVYTIRTVEGLLANTRTSMTLDTGHARIEGADAADQAAFVAEHPDRVGHVHLNDTRGPKDEHLPFGAGTVDFERIFEGFPDDWTGTLSIEAATGFDYLRHSKAALDSLV